LYLKIGLWITVTFGVTHIFIKVRRTDCYRTENSGNAVLSLSIVVNHSSFVYYQLVALWPTLTVNNVENRRVSKALRVGYCSSCAHQYKLISQFIALVS